MKKLILASQSPRRKELLEKLGVTFTVEPSNVNEDLALSLSPRKLAEELSRKKAQFIANKRKNCIIIAADTIVVLKKKIFGKPKSKKEAKEMLKALSGKTHQVITAFTIIDSKTEKRITKSVQTLVAFYKVTSKDLEKYLETEEVFDKAGAYAIQEGAGQFIKKIEGDYTNIVGLPIAAVKKALKNIGFAL